MIRIVLTGIACLWAASATAAIDIQEVTSENGHEAWLVEEPSIPFVNLELRFEGGASLDPEGKRGVTNLMVGLLEEGSGEMDARAFIAAQESLAASFSYDVGDDMVTVSARFLTENMDEAIALLRQSLVEPAFDDASITRVKGQVLSAIQADSTDPDTIAAKAFTARVFGDHPYGSMIQGTAESVEAITREDLVAAKEAAIVTSRAHVGAAGDISAEELGELMDTLFEGLPADGPPLPEAVEVETEADTEIVPFDTPQSVAVFGHAGIDRDDPDYFAAYVMNQILGGGGFEARLMTEVREKRGLTYGVYSYLADKDHADLVMGRVASANDRIAEAIEVIRAEWRRMAEEGVTQDELDQAKTYLTGAYPLRFDGNAPIANIIVGMQTQGLDPNYVNTRNDKVDAVTIEDVRRVAARLLKPEELLFVVVGQPEGLGAEVSQ
ncbi:pitrilysin family protein [Roseivivax sp. THAF30]|uniref:M16 family metallopeptidase n=1 Tax=Roseivivax sp. THAF30 TaxID=2587852 RepID=UPI001268FB20|nr:pitrilysin family protein [Roseivivax sp. THAF30]QFT61463.1 Peptidase M16 inactive domain protein [Roseivivax sp. THAF30]